MTVYTTTIITYLPKGGTAWTVETKVWATREEAERAVMRSTGQDRLPRPAASKCSFSGTVYTVFTDQNRWQTYHIGEVVVGAPGPINGGWYDSTRVVDVGPVARIGGVR